MTTYRRFCCNDLFRLGSLNMKQGVETRSLVSCLKDLVMWPDSSHVADAPGGRMTGYVFGAIGGNYFGELHTIVSLLGNETDVVQMLLNRLEYGCHEIYGVMEMRFVVPGSALCYLPVFFNRLSYEEEVNEHGAREAIMKTFLG